MFYRIPLVDVHSSLLNLGVRLTMGRFLLACLSCGFCFLKKLPAVRDPEPCSLDYGYPGEELIAMA
jgi:hypothetical protein